MVVDPKKRHSKQHVELGGKVQPANAIQVPTECNFSLSYVRIEPSSTHIANDVVHKSDMYSRYLLAHGKAIMTC